MQRIVRRDEIMKADLLSEVVLLGGGLVSLVCLMMVLMSLVSR